MRWIQESCGDLIAKATRQDATRSALLAALTANESGGCRQAYRFSPANHRRLVDLLSGGVDEVDGLTRAQLERRLEEARPAAERAALLTKLAGLHGYTQIAGYYAIVWKAPLEALLDKERHFVFAARLLERFCRKLELDPARHVAELGRCWSAGHPNGSAGAALYSWRLAERMKLYERMVLGKSEAAKGTTSACRDLMRTTETDDSRNRR